MTAEKQDSLCWMHTLHYRRCIPQMMVTPRYFILRMQQQLFHHYTRTGSCEVLNVLHGLQNALACISGAFAIGYWYLKVYFLKFDKICVYYCTL